MTASQGLCQSLSDLVQPSEKMKAHFVSPLTHPGNPHEPQRAAISGQVRPRQGTEICNFGAPSPLEALHWIFCFFSSMYVQFSKMSPLNSGESSEKSNGENRVKSCHVCGCHGFFCPDNHASSHCFPQTCNNKLPNIRSNTCKACVVGLLLSLADNKPALEFSIGLLCLRMSYHCRCLF